MASIMPAREDLDFEARLVEKPLSLDANCRLSLTLVWFALRGGRPEADMVSDARFLKNRHEDPNLRDLTGLDEPVAHISGGPRRPRSPCLGLPRCVHEGKTCATVAIGCTGGRHRPVSLIEDLARRMRAALMSDNTTIQIAVCHRGLDSTTEPDPIEAEQMGIR